MNQEAICHLDSRNWQKIKNLAEIFSDFSLNQNRIFIEIEYLKALAGQKIIRPLNTREIKFLERLRQQFNQEQFKQLKKIERKINHDLKAVEYYLKKKIENTSLQDLRPWVHFCLCSEDINNLAYGLMLKQAKEKILLPRLKKIVGRLRKMAQKTAGWPMLARTHGQPASPTTLGKEIMVFIKRLEKQLAIFRSLEIEGKLNGAVGNFNAHVLVKPQVNWLVFSEKFVKSLGLTANLYTSQILPYDSWLENFDCLKRINNILLGLVIDFWWYTSLGYLKLKVIKKEVGSSAMPHKVNPIDLEAAEGNLGFSNAMLAFFSEKLSRTRLQRDLSDSTVRRNIGLALAYSYFSYDSILRALARLKPDRWTMLSDLKAHPEVLDEAVQCRLKNQGQNQAYEKLKKLTRGKKISRQKLRKYIKIGPEEYLGLAEKLVKRGLK